MDRADRSSTGDEAAELRSQLADMQRQLACLDPAGAPEAVAGNGEAVRSNRSSLEARIEFMGDFDIVEASGVDVSEGGICFEVSDTLCFDMKVTTPEGEQIHRGNLVWMKRLDDGGCRLGFEFVPTSQSRDF